MGNLPACECWIRDSILLIVPFGFVRSVIFLRTKSRPPPSHDRSPRERPGLLTTSRTSARARRPSSAVRRPTRAPREIRVRRSPPPAHSGSALLPPTPPRAPSADLSPPPGPRVGVGTALRQRSTVGGAVPTKLARERLRARVIVLRDIARRPRPSRNHAEA